MSQGLLRSMAMAVCAAMAIFAFATHRCLVRGAEEMQASERAFDAGELELAVGHARRAASLYVPNAEHVAGGYERLQAVAAGAERMRDTELAMAAWRAVRAAALEGRHLWVPHDNELARARLNLTRLSGVPNDAVELPRHSGGHPVWGLRLTVGFAGALAGLLLLVRLGMSRTGRLDWARMRLPAALFAASLVSLCLALIRV